MSRRRRARPAVTSHVASETIVLPEGNVAGCPQTSVGTIPCVASALAVITSNTGVSRRGVLFRFGTRFAP